MKVSILLLTFNEEQNLPSCLASLSWCEDIVVVDSGSTHKTTEIAKAHGARVLTRPFDDFAGQRNWGLDNGGFRNHWVLHLDSDEIVTPDFVASIKEVTPAAGIDAYRIPSKMMLFNQWIRFAGMYPTYQVRLGHRERLRFIQVGHGQREDLPGDRVATFSVPYLHYSFSHGLFGWLQKHVRYARDEAALILELRRNGSAGAGGESSGDDDTSRRRAAKAKAARLPVMLRPLLRFIYIYFLKQGFRDGRAGLAYAFMLSIYEGMTAIFVLEAVLGGNAMPGPQNKKEIRE